MALMGGRYILGMIRHISTVDCIACLLIPRIFPVGKSRPVASRLTIAGSGIILRYVQSVVPGFTGMASIDPISGVAVFDEFSNSLG